MKTIAILAFLLVTACAGSADNAADANRNRLATVVASYGAAQKVALAYLERPTCGTTSTVICASPGVRVQIKNADRAANTAVNRANDAVKTNAAAPSTVTLLDGAFQAVEAFKGVVPQ